MKYYSILLISSLLSSTLFAASLNKRDAIQELVQKLEAFDPNIKSHQDDWLKVRNHLEQAAQQSETAAGLKLSIQHILDQWGGLRFRILDRDDAQYWAMNGETLALPKAWFTLRGSKWLVQYSAHPKLRRGDSFSAKDFSPYSRESQSQKSWTLAVQHKLMVEPVPATFELNKMPMSEWALELTQQSSKVALVDNKRICIEKVWFSLDKVVAKNIASKIDKASGLCQALLIDLRDSFGEGQSFWPKVSKKMPVAVLTNRGTREGAVALVKSLKKDSAAKVFGETTDSDRAAQSKENLTRIDWTILIVGDGGQIIPDQEIRDSSLNAEGVDDITEAGLGWIRAEITK
ncbi:MAG: hypothetical protein H7318_06795 [Oligoflexus sp.]|nr:hypothetical protein [Oligoflexus sp.]